MYDNYTVRRANGDFITVQELQIEDPVWQEESRGTLADMHVTIIEETFIKKKTFTPMECPTYIIRSGTFTTTAGVAETVNFASSMTDATYAIFITCWETARPTQNADWSFDESLAIDKFVIKTLVNATGRYVAISI